VLMMRILPSGESTINQMPTMMDKVDSSDPLYVWQLQIFDSTGCMKRKNWVVHHVAVFSTDHWGGRRSNAVLS
jgi:hypothetical protein